ncbi:MAG: DNA replication and repair protein RecF [bacterium]
MLLKKIDLHNFRNFKNNEFIFNPLLTLIIGENSKGKTNILEAIYFLIFGIGFRESREVELINFDNLKQAWVGGEYSLGDVKMEFKVVLKATGESIKKFFMIENTQKKHFQYLQEQTKTVLFTPQQIEILTGSPNKRRNYIDVTISSYDFEYKKRLNNYEGALRKRNKILERSSYGSDFDDEISFWNKFLIEQANYITNKRNEYFNFLNKNNKINSYEFNIKYLKNEFSKDRLLQYKNLEQRIKRTVIGPQKDDFEIYIEHSDKEEKNVQKFGSRSEQRLSILWLKFNEINLYEKHYKIKPILLFDDVFSELDTKNKKLVIHLLKKYQAVVTTTEVEVVHIAEIPKSIIKL